MKKTFSTLGCHDLSLREVIALAKKHCLDAIELRGLSGEMDNRKIPELLPENIEETRALLGSEGIRIAVLGASAKFDDPKAQEENLAEALASAELASKLGAPYIRVFGNRLRDSSTLFEVSCALMWLCEKCEGMGVGVLLEIHGDFNTQEALEPVVNALSGCGNFGLIYDVAHADRAYGDSFRELAEPLLGAVKHLHIKDCKRGDTPKLCSLGEGDIPVAEILSFFEERGFAGYASLEWERAWHPQLPKIDGELSKYCEM